MTDSTYIGGLTAWGNVAALQEAAEAKNAQAEVADCDHAVNQAGDITLTGQTANAAGSPLGSATVPNFSPVHVQTPVAKRGLPANLTTSPLGRSSGR